MWGLGLGFGEDFLTAQVYPSCQGDVAVDRIRVEPRVPHRPITGLPLTLLQGCTEEREKHLSPEPNTRSRSHLPILPQDFVRGWTR